MTKSSPSPHNHDFSCVPFKKKGFYFGMTIPFLLVSLGILIFLGVTNVWLALLYLYLYLHTSFFQAFCCVHQECPYIGGFCPAVIGILPAPYIAKWLKSTLKLPLSKKKFDFVINVAFIGFLGFIFLPIYWLFQAYFIVGISYIIIVVVYLLVFGFYICPSCAIRDTCPGGKVHQLFKRQK
ncbi:hypothetical protein NEF87_003851 [Candidatus Lokiarchaeum ossiferum]|uniref:DUF4395 domain-containing protein n=1 Tax=Candidatus Lokiarchaeum ossiferum TaxID=2951803 RepID=A0ABY6HYA8_9ARCH|nr:hypothetical protein NEF87_003851 [Candidatus Lokiarchaeum sp. B-35]